MKLDTFEECLKHVPTDAKSVMFIAGLSDNLKKFQKHVIRIMSRPESDLQRAVLVFEKGIPKETCLQTMRHIGKNLEDKYAADQPRKLHIMGRGGYKRSEIKAMVRRANRNHVTVRTWTNIDD